jgi:hypothetical protein
MPFLAPLALAGLLFLPLIVVFYLLKLRRDERQVSSTYLWRQLVQDVEANAPWQRLRRSLLLFLQLLLVIALAFLAARPFFEHAAGLARDLVLVLDASASMSATDELPNRLEAAKAAALHAMDGLPSDGRVSVVVAAGTARVVANETTDRGRLARAIGDVKSTPYSGGLEDALKLASKLADRHAGTEILLVTDAALATPPDVTLTAPLHVITVGRDRANQAIVALAVRSDPSSITRSVFVSVANYDTTTVDRQLEISIDGTLIDSRAVYIDPLSRADVVIDDLPAGARVVEAHLAGGDDEMAAQPAADRLALDDTAWAVVPQTRLRTILLVGPGNAYLQSALALLPDVELYGATAADYAKTTGKDLFDLIIFDGYLPAELPRNPILAIAPPSTSGLGTVQGTLTAPAIGQLDPSEPLLRYVDLSTTHVAKAQRLALPSWARTVIPGPRNAPLLYIGDRGGSPTAVLAFDLHQSDLPLQVAFPILVANVAGELFGQTADPIGARAPGSPVEIPLPPDAAGLRVTGPDATAVDVPASVSGAGSVTFAETAALGVYRVETIAAPSATSSPGASPSGSPAATATPIATPAGLGASASPGATPGSSDARFFAVDLFDEGESNITPGNGSALEALGAPGSGTAEPATSRDELWFPLALLALAVLLLEWLVYERDGLVRLRRAAAERAAAMRAGIERGGRPAAKDPG